MKKTLRILAFLFVFTFIFSINVFAETADYSGARYEITTIGGETIAVLDSILDNFNTVVVPEKVNGYFVKDVSNEIDGSNVINITFKNWSNIADKFDFTKFPNLQDIRIEQDTFAYGDPIGNFYTVSDSAIIRTYEHTRLYDKLDAMINVEGTKSFSLDGYTYGEAPDFVYDDPIERNAIIGINRSGMTTLSIPAGSVQKFSPFPYNSTNLMQCDYFGMNTVNSIDFYSMSPIEIYDLDKFQYLHYVSFFTDLGIGAMCDKYGFLYNEFDWGNPSYTGTLFEYEDIEGTNNIKITKYIPGQPGNDLRIPSEIDGKTVTCIGSEFNFDTGNNNRYIDIESVYIPDTVTTIEDGAFLHAYVHNFVFEGDTCDVENWITLTRFLHGIQVIDLSTNIYLHEGTEIETDLLAHGSGNYTIKGFDDVQIMFEKPYQKIITGDTWSWIDQDYRIIPDLPIDESLLTWSSDNENVVVYNGYLTVTGVGTAVVTLSYKNVQAQMTVEVLDGIVPDNIKMGSMVSEVQINEYIYLGKPVEPHIFIFGSDHNLLEEGTDYELVYSDNEGKGTGRVTINFIGSVKLYEKISDDIVERDSYQKTFEIYDPNDPTDDWGNVIGMFVINPLEKKTYNYGETIVITADGYNIEDGESLTVDFAGKQFAFNKEDNGKYVARVLVDDNLYYNNYTYPYTYYPMRYTVNNMVTQLPDGTWRGVYVSYNSDEIAFTLNPKQAAIVDVTKLETDENGMNLVVGETGTFHIRVYPENATNQAVIWTSEDPTIASVDNSGKVTAHKVGEVNIIATSDDNENITVTNKVVVAAPIYTVTLHLNGGTMSGGLTIPVNGGSTITEPHPEKSGYTIGGWYSDEGLNTEYTFDTPINGNMDLYVKWNLETYTITYNLDGGSQPNPPNPSEYTIESNDITLADPVNNGFEFQGWIESDGEEPVKNVTIPKGSVGDKHFTAVWSRINGSTVVETLDEITKESTIYAGEIFVDGVSQMQYLYSEDVSNTVTVLDNFRNAFPTKFATLISSTYTENDGLAVSTAHQDDINSNWTSSSYVANHYYSGTVGAETNNNLYDCDDTFKNYIDNLSAERQAEITDPDPSNKRVLSIKSTTVNSTYKFIDGVLRRVNTITLKLEATTVIYTTVNISSSETFTVSFETNGGGAIASQNITSGQKATRPSDPTKNGYKFMGWYADSGLTTEFNFNDTLITENKTIYAKWTKMIPVYRMYNPNSGEHLYTTDAHEVEIIFREQGWGKEGIAWYTGETGTPVFRLYNPKLGNHLYTSDRHEISVITKTQGWVLDFDGAPVMYANGDIPVYRLFNPGLQGQHHLTTDRNEYRVIPKWGWKQEGIAMKVLETGVPQTTTYYKK